MTAEASGPGARIGGIVLAAGEGRRFGERKQLAQLGGRPLAEHALVAAAAAPLTRTVLVLGAGADEVADPLDIDRPADLRIAEERLRVRGH